MSLLLANVAALALTGLGLLLLLALLHLQERAVGRYVAHRLGWRAALVTGWIGVPVHELAHLVTARLFGHRIIAWKLFDPNPESGTLGYVRHAHRRRTLWQMIGYFFVGVAPAIAGIALLLLLLMWMVSSRDWLALSQQLQQLGPSNRPLLTGHTFALFTQAKDLVLATVRTVWADRTALLPMQLYLGTCIAFHLAPSPSDFRNAGRGVTALLVLAVLAAATGAGLGASLAPVLTGLVPLVLALPLTALMQGVLVVVAACVP